jgi:NAD(P)-dependent dehydrogenase (short-subunit alcohol dehydrogenase family)
MSGGLGTGRLEGRVAVVTGAAQGIGAATARLMVAEGAAVVLGDLDGDGAAHVAASLGERAVGQRADVTVEDDVAALVATAVGRFGGLDVLHNNAVTSSAADTDAVGTPDEVWLDTYRVIVMAAAYGCRHAIPAMRERGGGAIVNTSSGAARSATGSRIAYGSCKAALETFTMYTATIHGAEGIRSNAVAPGFVLTKGTKELFDDDRLAQFAASAAAGRVCTPEDIADVVVFLASDAARYVNGQTVVVNGGGARALTW